MEFFLRCYCTSYVVIIKMFQIHCVLVHLDYFGFFFSVLWFSLLSELYSYHFSKTLPLSSHHSPIPHNTSNSLNVKKTSLNDIHKFTTHLFPSLFQHTGTEQPKILLFQNLLIQYSKSVLTFHLMLIFHFCRFVSG